YFPIYRTLMREADLNEDITENIVAVPVTKILILPPRLHALGASLQVKILSEQNMMIQELSTSPVPFFFFFLTLELVQNPLDWEI
ncbi:hypothetical protein ACJX0J_005689, partial [Zea mays]